MHLKKTKANSLDGEQRKIAFTPRLLIKILLKATYAAVTNVYFAFSNMVTSGAYDSQVKCSPGSRAEEQHAVKVLPQVFFQSFCALSTK